MKTLEISGGGLEIFENPGGGVPQNLIFLGGGGAPPPNFWPFFIVFLGVLGQTGIWPKNFQNWHYFLQGGCVILGQKVPLY